MFGLMGIVFLCFLAGMAIYAKYYECDPIQSERVKAADQLLPLFVMDTLGDYPGLPGLFVAGITAASLSTVSSALNSLAAIMTEDYVKKWKPNITDNQLGKLSKFIVFGFGVLAFGGTFLAKLLGDIFPAALLLVGTLLGPTLGIFSLGMFFPWANTIGSFLGMIGGLVLMLFLAVGSTIAENQKLLPNQKLPLSIEGCEVVNSTLSISPFLDTSWKDGDDSDLIKFLSLSSTWFPGLGFISTLVLGLLFTLFSTPFVERVRVDSRLISPPILKLYKKLLPSKYVNSFVKYEDSDKTPKILASSLVLDREFSTLRKDEADEDYTVTGFSSGKFDLKINH